MRGGQTVKCPWLLLGGVGSAVVADSELRRVDAAQPGDVLLLTKPIGGQVSVIFISFFCFMKNRRALFNFVQKGSVSYYSK